MFIFAAGLSQFFLILLAHFVLWRLLKPKSPAQLLVRVSSITVSGFCLFVYFYLSPSLFEVFYFSIWSAALISAYLISLPGIEAESPSSLIVFKVEEGGAKGVTRKDLEEVITDELFVLNRLESLKTDGLILENSEAIKITSAGKKFLSSFLLFHRVAKRKDLGG